MMSRNSRSAPTKRRTSRWATRSPGGPTRSSGRTGSAPSPISGRLGSSRSSNRSRRARTSSAVATTSVPAPNSPPPAARVRMAMVGLLAARGCVHPVCYRRVRVAVFAVGDHMVGPGEAPVMDRERNAAGATVVAPCLRWGDGPRPGRGRRARPRRCLGSILDSPDRGPDGPVERHVASGPLEGGRRTGLLRGFRFSRAVG